MTASLKCPSCGDSRLEPWAGPAIRCGGYLSLFQFVKFYPFPRQAEADKPATLPPDIAGAIGVYVDARRAKEQAWAATRGIDSRTKAAFNEENAQGNALLGMIWARFGKEGSE